MLLVRIEQQVSAMMLQDYNIYGRFDKWFKSLDFLSNIHGFESHTVCSQCGVYEPSD